MEKYDSGGQILLGSFIPYDTPSPEFYAYYADYDWVVFCWIFGNMLALPKGFPMYCIDLKQIMAEKELAIQKISPTYSIKKTKKYPKQRNEDNTIADVRWNEKLHR